MHRLRILFIDTDVYVQEKVRQALNSDFVIQCVDSVSEALQSLSSELPDVLVSEVTVGEESGLVLCRAIRKDPAQRHLPIMLLTSLTTLQDKVAGFDAGADDYVVKPFDPRHLLARIRLLARIKRLELRDQGGPI